MVRMEIGWEVVDWINLA